MKRTFKNKMTVENKRAVFYVDASPLIGGGHVMRCLVLADQLTAMGWDIAFICGSQTVATVHPLKTSKYEMHILTPGDFGKQDSLQLIAPQACDLLVIDSYDIDEMFEIKCRTWAKKIMVIDDLSNRAHDCDFLLDQTLGREGGDYMDLVPASCRLLMGPDYALLRPEFAAARPSALRRRSAIKKIDCLLVSFGMTDPENLTLLALEAIRQSSFLAKIVVVLGQAAPHLKAVKTFMDTMAHQTELHLDTQDMAGLMAEADLAIGGAGGTSWERCCLGLPAIVISGAKNQDLVLKKLAFRGAVVALCGKEEIKNDNITQALEKLLEKPEYHIKLSKSSMLICDGLGARRLTQNISSI